MQKQLDHINTINNNLINQIFYIQKSVEKLSGDIKYMNHILHNKFHLVKDRTSSDSTINDLTLNHMNKSLSENQSHSSPENRVTFDLHPQEINPVECPDSKVLHKSFRSRTPKAINSIFNKKFASS